jgi:acetyl esterase/lipase
VILYFHGGAYALGSARAGAALRNAGDFLRTH